MFHTWQTIPEEVIARQTPGGTGHYPVVALTDRGLGRSTQVVEICRQPSRNAFDFIGEAVQAHFAGHPTPSLLSGV